MKFIRCHDLVCSVLQFTGCGFNSWLGITAQWPWAS